MFPEFLSVIFLQSFAQDINVCCVSSYMPVDCWDGGVTIEIRDLLWTMVCTTVNLQHMYLVASFPVSTPNFFSHGVKKKAGGSLEDLLT